MDTSYPRKWENITNDKYAGCARLQVPGGWLVVAWTNRGAKNETLIFIHDPNYKWLLGAP